MLQLNWVSPDSSHSPHMGPENGMLEANVLNMSPRPSHNFSSQSSAEVTKEIASLEVEIMRLESYLLSLYRTAFHHQLPTLPESITTYSRCNSAATSQGKVDQKCYRLESEKRKGDIATYCQNSPPSGIVSSNNLNHSTSPRMTVTTDLKKGGSRHRSLADHLGASLVDKSLCSPDRLSEDIIKCISAIYCKLANPSSVTSGSSVSSTSTSSLSSSSTFSPRNLSDGWSPHCNVGETPVNGQLQDERKGYASFIIEVSKICLDDDSFSYASKMLEKFRLLVKGLETVDPMKMKREEKLAFWINIHNALVMHAYLAYGTQSNVRNSSILKAAYNVGGEHIDAYIIQTSILGIRPHYSLPWLQTLLSPGRKPKAGTSPHIYSIEYIEPLVHFALCSGAQSDPVVRVYTAENVFRELKLAKEEFVQARVYIHKETKILLPKILYYFAKDMSLNVPELLKVINDCLSEAQHAKIIKCLKGRADKYIHWLPQSSTFRYMIRRELAESVTFS